MRTAFALVCCLLLWLHSFGYCPVRDSILAIAERELGVTEETENFSPRISEYQLSCGWQTPVPWCACFISWVYLQCSLNTPRYGAAAKSWTELNTTSDYVPGDIGTIYYSKLGRIGHAFIIQAVDAKNFTTIEGNTRPGFVNDSEGDRVMRKVRPIGTVYAVANWVGDRQHTVAAGENLYRIGLRYGVSVSELQAINGLVNNYIQVGQTLKVKCV